MVSPFPFPPADRREAEGASPSRARLPWRIQQISRNFLIESWTHRASRRRCNLLCFATVYILYYLVSSSRLVFFVSDSVSPWPTAGCLRADLLVVIGFDPSRVLAGL
uniref:Uncharacterized protein n=1 Tax=Oryza sativa subsp. japonica TaxID=39947 RepID=Q5Z817_ORYSJ|nr:hypothetical protein [Oryza sativa Japonica Group]